ncbi:vacuolar protein-sorting-associated protein 36 [Monosporozyma servazzii]
MSYFHKVKTKSSGRPLLSQDEHDIVISDSVGLYELKERIVTKQNGRVFLTNKRIIYVDNVSPVDESVALHLDEIKSVEYQPGFLKRSSRLIIFLAPPKLSGKKNPAAGSRETLSEKNANDNDNFSTKWDCPICQAENTSKGKITTDTGDMPICDNCGIQMDFTMAKDSIKYMEADKVRRSNGIETKTIKCPACTFLNHPSMTICEICGTQLPQLKNGKSPSKKKHIISLIRPEYIQISFRKSDGSLFAQATTKEISDLRKIGIFNQNVASINGIDVKPREDVINIINQNSKSNTTETKIEFMGINGLERYRETQLMNNDILFNSALQDLNKLMSLAESIENLYKIKNKNSNLTQRINKLDLNKQSQSNLIIDRDKFLNQDLFLDEIAREIYDYAMLEFKDNEINNNVLIPLIDFYAMYNKAMRIGTGLISPQELKDACQRFPKLGLNDLKLIKLNKRILCLASTNSFDFIKREIIDILTQDAGLDVLRITQILNEIANDTKKTSDEETVQRQNATWTVSIIGEILQSCVDNGILVIDEQISGIYYFKNNF